ncbi:probable galacturonosyltransferase 7 isoform X2 [Asparagus officinalis]|uniref:probable galacturonosyltransferase 7 isoform X2 n=1 Tax=Asparagus officinalis TaxID=4686 RepID=UPI00098E72BF|nr:probable galacturonosyltransferase 7 isoform X2 [Asparagus officinalis]
MPAAKGHPSAAHPSKRRWRGNAIIVPALVFFSLLLPLAFLLGLPNRFPSGYFVDDRPSSEASLANFEREDADHEDNAENKTTQAEVNLHFEAYSEPTAVGAQTISQQAGTFTGLQDTASHTQVPPIVQTQVTLSEPPPASNVNKEDVDEKKNLFDVSMIDEAKKFCQIEFGSYCLWSIEHKEVMKDSVIKRLKDQLFVARAYYPSITKLQAQEQLSHELKQNIQEHEKMLSEAISDPDLPPLVMRKIEKMDQAIARAKSCTVDCSNIDKKLRQLLDLTEDESHFHMKQSAFLYQLGVQTIPKSIHCLSMRLTVEYFRSQSVDPDFDGEKFHSPNFRHYVIFSRNLLASSVTINSTVMSSEETEKLVFHLLTDVENYYAMKLWFSRNSYSKATVNVLNFDELYNTNDPYNTGAQMTLPEEFRVSIHNTEQQSSEQIRTEYISVFGHSHFLLSDIFKNLKKVVVLDDDVVVQQDLSSLWSLDLRGKVIGAVEFCGVRLWQLKTYLGKNNYNADSCAWMSGLSIVDLETWRQHNVTGIYQQVNHKLQSMTESSWRSAVLPASLLVFQNLIHPIDESWVLSGLGHNYGVSSSALHEAMVLHYNGNMKPWMELGIPKYKWHWKKYLTENEHYMDECNVNP